MLQHSYAQPTQDIDKQDKDSSYRIAAHKLAGAVHRTVKIGLLGHLLTPAPGLVLINQSRVQIRIDSHLLTRHGIQSEARAHL